MISNTLLTDYQNFIALSRYARWKEDEQRRETGVKLSADTLIIWLGICLASMAISFLIH